MVQPGGRASGIAMPFFLAHPRLMRLEKKMIIDVEGGTWNSCMNILRHEAGHVVQHTSYKLHRFGAAGSNCSACPTSKRYPRYYQPNPASRNYVQHLRLWYAQSHPEARIYSGRTFAVWLRPRSNWRTRYIGWPALKKLRYVDELMREIAGRRPSLTNREKVDPLSKFKETLGNGITSTSASFIWSIRRGPMTASCCGCSRRIQSTATPRPRHRSSGATAPGCASWSPDGPANISSPSMRCSTT